MEFVFYFLAAQQRKNSKYCSESEKQLQKHKKCLKIFVDMDFILVSVT